MDTGKYQLMSSDPIANPQPTPPTTPQEHPPRGEGLSPREDHSPEPHAQGSLVLTAALGLAFIVLSCLGYELVNTMWQKLSSVDLSSQPTSSATQKAPGLSIDPELHQKRQGSLKTTTRGYTSRSGSALLSLQCLSDGHVEREAPADPSNYGPRLAADWQGRPVRHTPALIVLHETVVDEATALNLFRRTHNNDGQQASYHVLISRDGSRIRVVPDAERAFGAGDSDFQNMAVQLKPGLLPSVNNIALHVSLVSPSDGADGERSSHSGYTPEQYRSLASQIAQWQALYAIQPSLVVTHEEVDRSGTRRDPRSFDWRSLSQDLRNRWLACGGSAPIADLGRAGSPAALQR